MCTQQRCYYSKIVITAVTHSHSTTQHTPTQRTALQQPRNNTQPDNAQPHNTTTAVVSAYNHSTGLLFVVCYLFVICLLFVVCGLSFAVCCLLCVTSKYETKHNTPTQATATRHTITALSLSLMLQTTRKTVSL